MQEEVIHQEADQSVKTGDNTQEEQAKTFTQEDVNGIAAKEVKKAQEKLLKDLGFNDFENAKDGLAKLKEWQESQKSEAEKQSEALKARETELSDAQNQMKALKAENAALKQGVNADSVEDVVALAERLVNEETTIDQAIKVVLDKYPQFGSVQDNEPKPTFAAKGNPSISTGNGVKDPFQDIIDNYK